MMQSQNPIRVLLVDDEEIIRYGLKAILQMENGVEVVGEACDGQAAIALAQTLKPDVILMDISMPVLDGVAATETIVQMLPQSKVLILTTHDEEQYLAEALQRGAAGYLLKNTPPQDFVHLIQTTHRGYLQLSPSLGQTLLTQLQSATPQPAACETACDWQGATPREQEVIKLIAGGANNREIAQMLYITEKTVKNHVSNILNRMGLRNRTQLAIWANRAVMNTANTLANTPLSA